MTDTTLTMTWTLHFSGPLTQKEKDTIIGNLWDHIHYEQDAGIEGFEKLTEVIAPDGKLRVTPQDIRDKVASAFREEGLPVRDWDKRDKRQ